MKRFLTLASVVTVAMIATTGFMPHRGQDAEFTLKIVPKKGVTLNYSLKATITISQGEADVTGTTVRTVTDIDDKGNITLEQAQKGMTVNIGGQQMDAPDQPSTVLVMTPQGLITDIKGEAVDSNAVRFAHIAEFIVPDKPVKIGDSWDKTTKADASTGAVDEKTTFTLLGEDTVGTIKCFKIKMAAAETTGDAPASANGTLWIAEDGGYAVKSVADYVNAPITGAPEPVNGNFVITLKPAATSTESN